MSAAASDPSQDAQRLVTLLRTGHALPDALHAALQAIRGTGDGDRLRVFTRAVQRALEGQR
ncbi:hypothetical protein J2W96_003550 [Variovorax guangxiensis]|nr:hypothetical protein [Variovorax guangxiensis]